MGLTDAIRLLEESAMAGPSSWFTNILRACANDLRERFANEPRAALPADVYKDEIIHQWEMILYDRGLRENTLNSFLSRIEQDLGSSTHDQVTKGVVDIGRMCGFDAFRPRRVSGMPDAVWRFYGPDKFLFTWEVKAELDRRVSIGDVNQAHSYGRWADSQYSSEGYNCFPFLLTVSTEMEEGVSDRLDNVRCIHRDNLISLFQAVRTIFRQFKSIWRPNDSQSRSNARGRVFGALPTYDWLHEAYCASEDGFIIESQIVSSWTSASR